MRLAIPATFDVARRERPRRQNGSTRTMIFKPAFLVSYLSQFMSLHPGDVITTGTPPGVGMGIKPDPVFLNVGDVIELGIEKLGRQRQVVAAGVKSGYSPPDRRVGWRELVCPHPFMVINSIGDLRVLARRRIPRALFDYIDRGSYDELTWNRNAPICAPRRCANACSSMSLKTIRRRDPRAR